jgi:hypothetical protein
MLLALQILRAFEEPVGDGTAVVDTHPPPGDRIAKISTRNLMQPKQLEMDQEFNGTVVRIMSTVAAIMRDARRKGGGELVATIRQRLHDAEMGLRN